MKALALVLTVIGLALVGYGCNGGTMGQSDQDIKKQSDAIKAYNEAKMKENPPPPGEGPSN
ncbi:MAG: hypothetical protein JSS66_18095 [Armatimonadetes bacterium]|nr:hypothetical protein [Armatimonadota bacterium]